MLPLFYHDRPPHSRKSTRKALKLCFLSRQTGCTRSFFTPQPPGCGKGGKSTAFMRVSSPKTTTENCMDYPVWNELFTFSTGFSTVFVKKKRSFQRCFPPFPHSFPHLTKESPIQAVMDAAAFWKFVGKNVGNLPFIKKKVEGFSFVFTVYSGLRVCFSPIWNFAPGSFPQTAGEKNPVWKTDTNCGFPHRKSFCTSAPSSVCSLRSQPPSPQGVKAFRCFVSKNNSLPCAVPFTHGHSCVKIRLQPAPLCRRGALLWYMIRR